MRGRLQWFSAKTEEKDGRKGSRPLYFALLYFALDWLKVAKKAGGLAVTADTGIPVIGIETLVNKLFVADPTMLSTGNVEAALSEARQFLKPGAETKNVPEVAASGRFVDWQKYRLGRLQSELRTEFKKSTYEK